MNLQETLFDRFVCRSRPFGVRIGVSAILLIVPVLCAWLDGILVQFFRVGQWRGFFTPVATILYIWNIAPFMKQRGEEVIRNFQPLVQMDEESFTHWVYQASRISPAREWIACVIGIALGIVNASFSGLDKNYPYTVLYWFISMGVMYGLLLWTIYMAVLSTRLTASLHRQTLYIDIFNLDPFNAVGKQSLLVALVFIGGITLSIVLSFQWDSLSSPVYWSVYLLLIMVTLLVFFLSMYPTHQVLSKHKAKELERIREHIQKSCKSLVENIELGEDTTILASKINALAIYEQRILGTSTWPYNTTMLRTLFFSVLIPLGTFLGRVIVEVAARN